MALGGLADTSSVLVACEPVWAIGRQGREPRPEEVAPVVAAVQLQHWHGRVAAILYGGPVTNSNAAALLAAPGAGGLFAGRSAWTPSGFLRLVDIAEPARQAKGSSAP